DSESTYFLNGTRCRRRDIIDIFLGTGLGPRSYSIIGQNMISRVIEAKPDDMRVYLEEAAGVSKYKERRRETENRIQHTKDNLARLNDIRVELERQLTTLKRQSGAAEKYKLLKQEERVLRAQWLAVQWRQFDTHLIQDTLKIQQQETGLEARQTELGKINLTGEQKREAQRVASEAFQEVQRRYYSVGNDIARFEQDIHHQEERLRQFGADIAMVDQDSSEINNTLEEATQERQDLFSEINQIEPEMKESIEHAAQAAAAVTQAEDTMQAWQTEWDTFNQQTSNTAQTAQVEQTRIQHLEQKLAAIKQRQAILEEEYSQLDFSKLNSEIEELSHLISDTTNETEHRQQALADARKATAALQTKQQQTAHDLDEVRNELQQLRGQEASLEALQQTALGQRNNRAIEWLEQHRLDKHPRLAQEMKVESGWELAVEKVLGAHLQAVCVDVLSDVVKLADELQHGNLCVLAKNAKSTSTAITANKLLSKVTSSWPLESLLSGIYIAESQTDALTIADRLLPNESVITREGVWMGLSWLRITRDENPEAGVFQREQELKQLARKIRDLTETHDTLEKTLEQDSEQLKELQKQCDELQKIANQSHAQSAEVQAQQKIKQERLLELKARVERVQKEQEESANQLKQAQIELTHSRSNWQQAMTALEQQSKQRDTLAARRDSLRERVHLARESLNQTKENVHQLEIRLQTTKSQCASLEQTITRMQMQLTTLAERKITLQKELNSLPPIEMIEKELSGALSTRLVIEDELSKARGAVDIINHDLQELDAHRQEVEREAAKFRDLLETLRVGCQGLKVKAENVAEQLSETGLQLQEVLKQLPEETVASEWQAQLEQTTQRISRLGPINLVAIEEYAACAERKEYLDKQNDDLQEGLATLENAIEKIDKETRAKFKEAFDKVNERFQELFPKVFGGGRAYLELTGENLLDAGITVMACPPGKRNSTIHLLSGGEKAMTAIALVFSIFHLNPAPFCLLDEVDAPLDDTNIGRFCLLVKEMSKKTQFIFISHNKLAIEMGEHLMGVTMHEPGVSRLVSVNVQEAVSLAET
ncbi:MAG TPA: chromosome segregation protein SMC, partial [Gammaproteobacteria bacterium]|nr:chromosome segregation protein SMC [Gammaproteobacteria bacterium]